MPTACPRPTICWPSATVRNLLFGNGGQTDNGQDLIARDIERARDDGIGTYNQLRVAYGLPPVTSFAQITSNVPVQKELQSRLRDRRQHRSL